MVKAPVLFVTFARPEYARSTFEEIKKARPEKLYFYSDKARLNKEGEKEKNEYIRSFVNEIDWPCQLKTFFRKEHSGNVDLSLWGAYDWFFENEEYGIVLEEDCVPSLAFFDFCDQLLVEYRDEKRIWVISGNNFIEEYNDNGYDFFFSNFPFMYGWASWRDRWQNVIRGPLPYEKIKEYRLFDQIYADRKAAQKALRFTEKIVNTPCWDYRFTISMKCNGGFGIIPRTNLVSNIGLAGEHNKGQKSFFHHRALPSYEKYLINKRPPFIVPDYGYSDYWYRHYYFRSTGIMYRIRRKVQNMISKLARSK